MIKLTRMNGSELYINPDLIEIMDEVPETHLTLINGNRYIVLEPARIVIERIVALKARIGARSLLRSPRRHHIAALQQYRPFCQMPDNV